MSCKSNKCNESNPCNKCQQDIITPSCDLCDFQVPSKCVTVSNDVPCLNIQAGETLQDALSKLCGIGDGGFIGIDDVSVSEGGDLIIELTNGETINAGVVAGTDGVDGVNGTNGVGIESVVSNTDGTITITYTDTNTSTINFPAPKVYFGDNIVDPNNATALTPLLDSDGSTIYNGSTINPITSSIFIHTTTRDIWRWNGTLWSKEHSTGNYLEHTEYDNTQSSTGSPLSQSLIEYTTKTILEENEKYKCTMHGVLYDDVKINVFLNTFSTSYQIGQIFHELQGGRQTFFVTFTVTKKSNSEYYVGVHGSINIGSGYPGVWTGNAQNSNSFNNSFAVSLDTTVPLTIEIEGQTESPIRVDSIKINEFSVEKIKP